MGSQPRQSQPRPILSVELDKRNELLPCSFSAIHLRTYIVSLYLRDSWRLDSNRRASCLQSRPPILTSVTCSFQIHILLIHPKNGLQDEAQERLEPRFMSAPVSVNTGLPDAQARVRACYLSHRAVWSEVAVSWEHPNWHNFGREGAGWTMIFEDDMMVHPNTSIRELHLILRTTAI